GLRALKYLFFLLLPLERVEVILEPGFRRAWRNRGWIVQRCLLGASGRVPYIDQSILARRRQGLAIGGKDEGQNTRSVPAQRGLEFSIRHVPQFHQSLPRSASEKSGVGCKGQLRNSGRLALNDLTNLARGRVP